jgi:hypothetical protein
MGFKRKLSLLAVLVALISYIWYFDIQFSQDVIAITVGIAIILFAGAAEEVDKMHRHSIRNKVILILVLAVEIFYIWYFNVAVEGTVIVLLIFLVFTFLMALAEGARPAGY